jgi:hypothetical protein
MPPSFLGFMCRPEFFVLSGFMVLGGFPVVAGGVRQVF